MRKVWDVVLGAELRVSFLHGTPRPIQVCLRLRPRSGEVFIAGALGYKVYRVQYFLLLSRWQQIQPFDNRVCILITIIPFRCVTFRRDLLEHDDRPDDISLFHLVERGFHIAEFDGLRDHAVEFEFAL